MPGRHEPPPPLDDARRADLASSFQRAAIGALILKLERAINQLEERGVEIRSILVGGGVSANSRLRRDLAALSESRTVPLRVPAMQYCLDNAAMIAGLAHQRLIMGDVDDLALEAIPTTAS